MAEIFKWWVLHGDVFYGEYLEYYLNDDHLEAEDMLLLMDDRIPGFSSFLNPSHGGLEFLQFLRKAVEDGAPQPDFCEFGKAAMHFYELDECRNEESESFEYLEEQLSWRFCHRLLYIRGRGEMRDLVKIYQNSKNSSDTCDTFTNECEGDALNDQQSTKDKSTDSEDCFSDVTCTEKPVAKDSQSLSPNQCGSSMESATPSVLSDTTSAEDQSLYGDNTCSSGVVGSLDVNVVLEVEESCRSDKIEVNVEERQYNVTQENARVADATAMISETNLSAITHGVSADSTAYVCEKKLTRSSQINKGEVEEWSYGREANFSVLHDEIVEMENPGVSPIMSNAGDISLSVSSALKYPWIDEHYVTSGTRRGVLLTDNMSDLSTCHMWSILLSKSSDNPAFIPDFDISLSKSSDNPVFIPDFGMSVPPDIANYVHPNVSWHVSPKSLSPKPTDRLVPVLLGMTLWWFLDRSTSTHQCYSNNPKLSLSGNHKVPQFDMPELSMPDSCGIHSLPFDFPDSISSNSFKCLSSGIPDSSPRASVRSLTGIADTFSSDRSTYECSTSITHNIASLTFSFKKSVKQESLNHSRTRRYKTLNIYKYVQ